MREEFERADQIAGGTLRHTKRKALDWLVEQVEIVDEDGQPIDATALALDEQAATRTATTRSPTTMTTPQTRATEQDA